MADKDDKNAVKVEADGKDKKDDKSAKDKKKDKKKEEDELSEEDKQKKEELELLVQRVQDPDEGIARVALEKMVEELKTSTSSMTSVPKALKFLRPSYPILQTYYLEKLKAGSLKQFFADVLSVLATTMQKEGDRDSLKYRLEGSKEGLTSWGGEYLRSLSGEISQEYNKRVQAQEKCDDILRDAASDGDVLQHISIPELLKVRHSVDLMDGIEDKLSAMDISPDDELQH